MFSDRQLCEQHPKLYGIQAAFSVLLKAVEAGQTAQVFMMQDSLQPAYICRSLTHGLSMLAIDNQLAIADKNELLLLSQKATRIVSTGSKQALDIS